MDVVDTVQNAGAAPGIVQPWTDSGLAVTFTIDPHTGLGGAVSRVLATGARPVAVMDALRLGPLDASGTRGELPDVVAAIGHANDLGLPTIGGEVVFDPVYQGNTLVNVLCVGVAEGSVDDTGRVPDGEAPTLQEHPVPDGPGVRPDWIDGLNADRAEVLPRASGADLGQHLLRLVGSPHLCDRSWITDQFDRYVGGNTVLAQPEDAGVVRVDERTARGIALALDNNPRYCLLNPYLGAQLALGESYRNVAMTGARPVAAATCLNVGPPDDPTVQWQLRESALGLADGTAELGTPVTDSTVGFQHHPGPSIHPTPLVAVLGVLDDVAGRTPLGFAYPGDAVVLVGETKEELSGSVWADIVHGHLGGMPPMPNLAAEKALAHVLVEASGRRLLTSAHDLAEGGLAQALVESALRHGLGVALTLPDGDPTVQLFSESPARAVVSLAGPQYAEFVALCTDAGVPFERLGEVIEEPVLEVHGQFRLDLSEVRARWAAPIRAALRGSG